MYFPFIPKAEALALLEDAEHAAESRSEFIAERDSGAVSLGFSPSDALWSAQTELAFMEAEFAQSEEGERYFARLQAARLYEGIPSLHERDIPEFTLGDSDEGAAHELALRDFYAPLPEGRSVSNDIPF